MAKLLTNDTAAKVLRMLSQKNMTQGGGMPRDLAGDDSEPLLYDLRAVTRNDVKELQVYAPADMPLMYDRDTVYFAATALTRDTKDDNYISLSGVVSPGSPVYAYWDKSTETILFSSTEPEPVDYVVPPFVKVGSTSVTGEKVSITQAFLGHYAITSAAEVKIQPWDCRLNSETGTVTVYIPANSLMLNGIDMTAGITGYGPAGAVAVTGSWYAISSASVTNLYILMNPFREQKGTVLSVDLGTSAPSTLYQNQELITMPIYNPATSTQYASGQIVHEIIRCDGSPSNGNNNKSIDLTIDGGTGDKTLQVHGFKSPTGLSEPLGTNSNTAHSFPVREYIGAWEQAEIRYVSYEDIATAVKGTFDEEGYWPTCDPDYSGTWWTWYDSLTGDNRKFWERGADYTINHGSSIGNGTAMVIDLNAPMLIGPAGSWWCQADFKPQATYAFDLGNESYAWRAGHIDDIYTTSIYGKGTGAIGICDNVIAPFGAKLGDNSTATYAFDGVYLLDASHVYIGTDALLTVRQAAVADATGLGDIVAQFNALCAIVRTHNLMAP